VKIKDLTIDADSRAVGHEAHAADFNGIRVKSDTSRGGLVSDITYDGVCMRDMVNAIPRQHGVQPAVRRRLPPGLQGAHLQGHPPRELHGAEPTGRDAGGLQRDRDSRADHARQRRDRELRPRAVRPSSRTSWMGPRDSNFQPGGATVGSIDNQVTRAASPKALRRSRSCTAPAEPAGWKR
jgi:hypothetical protein